MADGWARITEQPGICMYTTPGFANAIPGLTNAMHSESPVISIAGVFLIRSETADHPITGGYLQPMTVIDADLWKIAQLSPGDEVTFRFVS